MPIINRFCYSRLIRLLTADTLNYAELTLYDYSTQRNIILARGLYFNDDSIRSIVDKLVRKLITLADILKTVYNGEVPNNSFSYDYAEFLMNIAKDGTSTTQGIKDQCAIHKEAISLAMIRAANQDYQKDYPCKIKVSEDDILSSSKLYNTIDNFTSVFSSSCYIMNYCQNTTYSSFEPNYLLRYDFPEIFDKEKYHNQIGEIARRYKAHMQGVNIYPLGFCSIIEYKGEVYFITPEIVNRTTNYLDGLIKLKYASGSLSIYPNSSFISELHNLIIRSSRIDPEFIGEAIKACRNIMVAELASDDILGEPMTSLLTREYEPLKLTMANRFKDLISTYTASIRGSINLSMIYKIVIHPDIDMSASFGKLDGLYSPNRVDNDEFSYMSGVLRRSLYISMYKAGYGPRIAEGPLSTLQGGSEHNYHQLSNSSPILWADCTFDVCRSKIGRAHV